VRYLEALLGGIFFLLIGMAAAALMYGLAESIRLLFLLPEQRAYEKRVQVLMDQLRRNELTQPFCLYLRSFRAGFSMSWFNLSTSRQYAPALVEKSFDEHLVNALAPIGPVVCLGNQGYAVGAARIHTTDEQWRSDVALLLQSATLVVLVPWHTDSVMEEFAEILKTTSLQKKAVFFMPPDAAGLLVAQQWEIAMKRFLDKGMRLPAFEPDGALFNSRGNLISWRFVTDEDSLRDAILQLSTKKVGIFGQRLPQSKRKKALVKK
jgi:hypothetical protein